MNTLHAHRRGMVIAIIIVGLVTFGWYSYHYEQKRNGIILTPRTAIDTTTIEEKVYTAENPYLTLDIRYPAFSQADEAFNKAIADTLFTAAADATKDASDNWQARYDTQDASTPKAERISATPSAAEKMPFSAEYVVVQSNNVLISVIVRVHAFTGGAHGYESLYTFNYNVVKKTPITLADVYANDQSYLQTISQKTNAALRAQFTAAKTLDDTVAQMIDEGTAPLAENFSSFTISHQKDGSRAITFYFAEYQVAPYSYGTPQVTLPLE